MNVLESALALVLAFGMLAAAGQGAFAGSKHHHHKAAPQPKVEYLRAAGSPK